MKIAVPHNQLKLNNQRKFQKINKIKTRKQLLQNHPNHLQTINQKSLLALLQLLSKKRKQNLQRIRNYRCLIMLLMLLDKLLFKIKLPSLLLKKLLNSFSKNTETCVQYLYWLLLEIFSELVYSLNLNHITLLMKVFLNN